MEILLILLLITTFATSLFVLQMLIKIDKEGEEAREARKDEIARLNSIIFYLEEISEKLSGHRKSKNSD